MRVEEIIHHFQWAKLWLIFLSPKAWRSCLPFSKWRHCILQPKVRSQHGTSFRFHCSFHVGATTSNLVALIGCGSHERDIFWGKCTFSNGLKAFNWNPCPQPVQEVSEKGWWGTIFLDLEDGLRTRWKAIKQDPIAPCPHHESQYSIVKVSHIPPFLFLSHYYSPPPSPSLFKYPAILEDVFSHKERRFLDWGTNCSSWCAHYSIQQTWLGRIWTVHHGVQMMPE